MTASRATLGSKPAPPRPVTATRSDLQIGCSGWNYEHWRHGVFYPARMPSRQWLEFYAGRFCTVEVNTTFYRLPRRESVEGWARATPDGFTFAVKVSRYLTHVRRLREAGAHLQILLDRIEPLVRAEKLGPLLWQLPPSFSRDDERLASTLEAIPLDLRHAFEFRHESWFADEVIDLLRAYNVALVIADRPEIEAFQTRHLTADFAYVRFHHGSRGRRGNYSESELEHWAAVIEGFGRPTYAYFNNDWEGFAPANALRLEALSAAEPAA